MPASEDHIQHRLLVLGADDAGRVWHALDGFTARLLPLHELTAEACRGIDVAVLYAQEAAPMEAIAARLQAYRKDCPFPVVLAGRANAPATTALFDGERVDGFVEPSWPPELIAQCLSIAIRHVQLGANVVEIQEIALEAARQEVASLYELATRDELTLLYNRRHFHEIIMREHERHRRQSTAYTILFLDMDDLKRINTRHGHNAGSQAIQHLAKSMRRVIRASDYAFRYGGDEFLVLLPDADASGGHGVGRRVCSALRCNPLVLGERQETVTVSIGLASFPDGGGGPDEVVQNADKALFAAKAKGKDRVHVFKSRALSSSPSA